MDDPAMFIERESSKVEDDLKSNSNAYLFEDDPKAKTNKT